MCSARFSGRSSVSVYSLVRSFRFYLGKPPPRHGHSHGAIVSQGTRDSTSFPSYAVDYLRAEPQRVVCSSSRDHFGKDQSAGCAEGQASKQTRLQGQTYTPIREPGSSKDHGRSALQSVNGAALFLLTGAASVDVFFFPSEALLFSSEERGRR